MEEETNINKMTLEEIQTLKKKRVTLMKDNLPALRIQDEYSRLKANIAENILREEMVKVKHAQLRMPPEPEGKPEKPPKKKP